MGGMIIMLEKTIIVLTVFIVGLMAISTVSAQSDTAEDIELSKKKREKFMPLRNKQTEGLC